MKAKMREEAEGGKGDGGNILVEGVRYLFFFLSFLPGSQALGIRHNTTIESCMT